MQTHSLLNVDAYFSAQELADRNGKPGEDLCFGLCAVLEMKAVTDDQ